MCVRVRNTHVVRGRGVQDAKCFLVTLATNLLPFTTPSTYTRTLQRKLTLYNNPLLLSLFPFLVISALLVRYPTTSILKLPFYPTTELVKIHTPTTKQILLVKFLNNFTPTTDTTTKTIHSKRLATQRTSTLLPTYIYSNPSFIVLTIKRSVLNDTRLNILLFLTRITTNCLSTTLLTQLKKALKSVTRPTIPATSRPLQLSNVVTRTTRACLGLYNFILFFQVLTTKTKRILPSNTNIFYTVLLRIYSNYSLTTGDNQFTDVLYYTTLDIRKLSILVRIQAVYPPRVALHPLCHTQLFRLPLSLLMFCLLLPRQTRRAFDALYNHIAVVHHLPPSYTLLIFLNYYFIIYRLDHILTGRPGRARESGITGRS